MVIYKLRRKWGIGSAVGNDLGAATHGAYTAPSYCGAYRLLRLLFGGADVAREAHLAAAGQRLRRRRRGLGRQRL